MVDGSWSVDDGHSSYRVLEQLDAASMSISRGFGRTQGCQTKVLMSCNVYSYREYVLERIGIKCTTGGFI